MNKTYKLKEDKLCVSTFKYNGKTIAAKFVYASLQELLKFYSVYSHEALIKVKNMTHRRKDAQANTERSQCPRTTSKTLFFFVENVFCL